MDVTDYCALERDGVRFAERDASRFAKGVAGDFNPIHDPGSRRFCVPGDLLFGVLLHRYGAFAESAVRFAGMLDAEVELALPAALENEAVHLVDPRGREVLSFHGAGGEVGGRDFAARLAHEYVRFSGRTFPEILVPLMREAGMMISPERPLVIYKDMAFSIEAAPDGPIELSLADADLTLAGKKGVARLRFEIAAGGARIGEGEKNLVLGGLRPFDETAMASVVETYEARRRQFLAGEGAPDAL